MHHSRRKSGHGLPNSSATDLRKSTAVSATDPAKYKRPSLTRKHTPQKLGRSQRDRERERHEAWEDEHESFPEYCMTCEKQFIPHDDMFLYCSESCRRIDQNSTSQTPSSVRSYVPSTNSYPYYSAGNPEPRDIIPRASPSRPSAMYLTSPPTTPGAGAGAYQRTSAISSLRSLNVGPPSPPSPTGSSSNLWPFSRSAATSPNNSYQKPAASYFSSTYDGAYYGGGAAYGYDSASGGMDRPRPLPSRYPGAYSRPKSIELVTPMVGR